MPKQTVEVPVPEGWLIAAYRVPLEGEHYLHDGEAVEALTDFTDDRLVLVADWRWPSWLKAGWIAMDKDGQWYAYNDEPVIDDAAEYWFADADYGEALIDPDMFRFDPPTCDDWRTSLRQNPAYQVKL